MKKYISLLLVAMLTLSMTACNGAPADKSSSQIADTAETSTTEPQGAKEEIVFWSLLGGGDGELLEKMIAEYNETDPAYPVKHYVQDWGEYYNKLTFSVLSGEAPDVAISHATRLLQLADQKVIEPLSTVNGSDSVDWGNFVTNAKEKVTVDGETYAVPFDFHGYLLFFNTDILTRAGVISSADQLPTINSFDDLLAALDKVAELEENKNTDKADDIMPLGLQTEGDVPFKVWYNLYAQKNGEQLLSQDGNNVTMSKQAAEEAVEALLSLYNKGYAGVYNNQWEDFKAGKSAFVISFTSDVASFNTALSGKMNVMSFPQLFDNNKVFADSHSFVFPVKDKRSDEKEAAIVAFVNWMVNSGKWMETGHFPTTLSVLNSDSYNALPFVKNYKGSIENLTFISGSKNSWLMSPPKTMENFDKIYASRTTITGSDAADMIQQGLESDK